MSHNNSIKILLNIKDKNISFEKNWISDKVIKNVNSKVFHAKLSYDPQYCSCCSCDGSSVIKHGFNKASLITLPKVSNFNTYLSLKKQRFFCKECNSTFIASTILVQKNCHISKNSKLAIALEAKIKISEKDIAHRFSVSHSTVNRVLRSHFSDYTPNKNYLPKVLCFDEFKSVKSSHAAMSFIMCDGVTHKIVDIIEDRKLNNLMDYFSSYTLKARNNVEHIVIDMYSPYLSLIKKIFPLAKVSIDRFHLVQLINRAFNKYRINLMNNYINKEKPFYNKIKNNWKLLLKKCTKLSYEKKYNRNFKQYISEHEIVDYILKKDKDLSTAYDIYQDFLYATNKKDFDTFRYLTEEHYNTENKLLKTSIKTFKKYLDQIENSLNYSYSNGPLEGINNKIKVIKRTAFGYRSFLNLRRRIFISCNLVNIKETLVA